MNSTLVVRPVSPDTRRSAWPTIDHVSGDLSPPVSPPIRQIALTSPEAAADICVWRRAGCLGCEENCKSSSLRLFLTSCLGSNHWCGHWCLSAGNVRFKVGCKRKIISLLRWMICLETGKTSGIQDLMMRLHPCQPAFLAILVVLGDLETS